MSPSSINDCGELGGVRARTRHGRYGAATLAALSALTLSRVVVAEEELEGSGAWSEGAREEESPRAPDRAVTTPDAATSGPSSEDAAAAGAAVAGAPALPEREPEPRSAGPVVLGHTDGTRGSGVEVGLGGWSFSYHGYFRAPLRFAIAQRDPEQRTGPLLPGATPDAPPQQVAPPGQDPSTWDADAASRAYSRTTFHLPLVPDDQALSWQHTRHNETDWAELFLGVGNDLVRGTVSIEGYNFTQSSFADPETQFGIAQGYVTLTPPLPWQNVRLSLTAGTNWNRYGMAGRYDAGEYDTFLFGRTKVMGLTAREEFDVGGATLSFEQGFGGKRPHPSKYNTAKFTLLGHGHASLRYGPLTLGLHLLHAFASEEDRDGQGCPGGPSGVQDSTGLPTVSGACSRLWGGDGAVGVSRAVGGVSGFGKFASGAEGNVWLPDGRLTVFGPELVLDAGGAGRLYLGYSQIRAHNALTVAGAVEVLHSSGGGEFSLGVTNNFLDNPQCNPAKGECSSGGTGTVHTLAAQYDLGLHDLLSSLREGRRFWGEGWELQGKLYGMLSAVESAYAVDRDGSLGAKDRYGGVGAGAPAGASAVPNYWISQGDNYSSHRQLKLGADLFASVFPVLGLGARFDRVVPNDHLPGQSFSVLSPRLELRSRWVTRERITLQYSRYFYAQRTCALLSPYDPAKVIGSAAPIDFDFDGSPQNFTGMPATNDCAQLPSGPRLPEGWGATAEEVALNWRGAPISGGNPNHTRPDVNVVKIEAAMWW